MARKIYEQKSAPVRRHQEDEIRDIPNEVNEVTAKVGDLVLGMLLEIDDVLGDGPDAPDAEPQPGPDELPPEAGHPEAA